MAIRKYYIYDKKTGKYHRDENGMRIVVNEGWRKRHRDREANISFLSIEDGHKPLDSINNYSGGWNGLD